MHPEAKHVHEGVDEKSPLDHMPYQMADHFGLRANISLLLMDP